MEDQFIQLQLEDASSEVNKALLPYDIIIRVDESGKPSSFTLELNHEYRSNEDVIEYYDTLQKENAPAFDMETEIIAMNRYYNKGVTND